MATAILPTPEHIHYNRTNYPIYVATVANWDYCTDDNGACAAIPTVEGAARGAKASHMGTIEYVRRLLAERAA